MIEEMNLTEFVVARVVEAEARMGKLRVLVVVNRREAVRLRWR